MDGYVTEIEVVEPNARLGSQLAGLGFLRHNIQQAQEIFPNRLSALEIDFVEP